LPARSTLIDDLAAGHSVTRPHLGVALAPAEVAARLRRSVGLPERDGLLVRGVEPDSPAARAGIAEGDLLVAVGETPLRSIDILHQALTTATTSLGLTVVRGSEERTVEVTFETDQPADTGTA
jgi:serine protease Do